MPRVVMDLYSPLADATYRTIVDSVAAGTSSYQVTLRKLDATANPANPT